MADYIKRDDAINAFDDPRVERNYGDVSPSSVIDVIQTIPAADVRENKRGKWVRPNDNPFVKPKCSVCGMSCFGLHAFDCDESEFCPSCGADMRPRDNE